MRQNGGYAKTTKLSDNEDDAEYDLEEISRTPGIKMAATMAEAEVVDLADDDDDDDDDDDVEEEGPEVVMLKDELTLSEGDTATLQCHVTGVPVPKIKWRKGTHYNVSLLSMLESISYCDVHNSF